MRVGDDIFVEMPQGRLEGVLLRGVLEGMEGAAFTTAFSREAVLFDPMDQVGLFFVIKNRFSQQAARIEAKETDAEGRVMLTFVLLGEAVSAESRQSYRVSAWVSGLVAQVQLDEECSVLDVSLTGLAITSTRRHRVGDDVRVALEFDGEIRVGSAVVRSAMTLGRDQYRYGLHARPDQPGESLLECLNQITMSLQRAQLVRLAGRG